METIAKIKEFWNKNKTAIKVVVIGGTIAYFVGFSKGSLMASSNSNRWLNDFIHDLPEELELLTWLSEHGYTADSIKKLINGMEECSLDDLADILRNYGLDVTFCITNE